MSSAITASFTRIGHGAAAITALVALVFVAPLLLSDYPAALLSFARYLAFGLIEYYEFFLGPFPWSEFNIIQMNTYGYGQAPPATIAMVTATIFKLVAASVAIVSRFSGSMAIPRTTESSARSFRARSDR